MGSWEEIIGGLTWYLLVVGVNRTPPHLVKKGNMSSCTGEPFIDSWPSD